MTMGLSTRRAAVVAAVLLLLAGAAGSQDLPGPADKTDKPGKADKADDKGAADQGTEQSAWDTSELSAVKFGSTLAGPDGDLEMLRGNVVIVLFWHAMDDRSVSALGALKQFHDANRSAGFAALANDASAIRDKAFAAVHNLHPNFPVSAGLTLPLPQILKAGQTTRDGKQLTTILYDHMGTAKAAFVTFNAEARDAAIKLLRQRPHPILGPKPYKKIGAIVTQVRAGQYGQALKACQAAGANAKADEDTKTEASTVEKALTAHADRLTKLAIDKQPQWPSQTVRLLTEVQRLYRGTEPGQEAAKQLAELQKDKTFLRSLTAERELLALRSAAAGIPSCPATVQDKKKWQAKFGGAAADLRRRAALLKKNFPNTWHADQAEALASELAG